MPPGVQPINGSEAIGQFWTDLIKAGNRKNFAIDIASIQRDGKYAYQTARWTLDLVKDNGEVTKVVGSSVRIFEEQDGKWLAKVHIYNVYYLGSIAALWQERRISFAVSGCPSSKPRADTVIE